MASEVKLDNVALDIDPDDYLMLGGRRRGSVHRLLDGSTVYQDRGLDATDLVIQISGMLTNVATLKSLWAIYRKTSHTATLEDFKGNKFSVVFAPGQESFNVVPIRGSSRGFTYRMLFNVVAVLTWFDVEDGFPSTT